MTGAWVSLGCAYTVGGSCLVSLRTGVSGRRPWTLRSGSASSSAECCTWLSWLPVL